VHLCITVQLLLASAAFETCLVPNSCFWTLRLLRDVRLLIASRTYILSTDDCRFCWWLEGQLCVSCLKPSYINRLWLVYNLFGNLCSTSLAVSLILNFNVSFSANRLCTCRAIEAVVVIAFVIEFLLCKSREYAM
jgi:hypothetical protein